MKLNLFFLILVILFITYSCSNSTDSPTQNFVTGTVLDENGNPVPDAYVCVLPDIPNQITKKGKDNSITWILSAELNYFKVSTYYKYNIINWQTASEINTDRFEIERASGNDSSNISFSVIGMVKAAGKSTSPRNYNLTDSSIETNKFFYYRLKTIDIDGSFSYSNQIIIRSHDTVPSFEAIYPNPAFDILILNFIIPSPKIIRLGMIEKSTGKSIEFINNEQKAGEYSFESSLENPDNSKQKIRPGVYLIQMGYDSKIISRDIVVGFRFSTGNCEIPMEVTKTDKNGKFTIPNKYFPDVQQFVRCYENGQSGNPFTYGLTATVITRKTVNSSSMKDEYLVSKNEIRIDKSKPLNIECVAKKYTVYK